MELIKNKPIRSFSFLYFLIIQQIHVYCNLNNTNTLSNNNRNIRSSNQQQQQQQLQQQQIDNIYSSLNNQNFFNYVPYSEIKNRIEVFPDNLLKKRENKQINQEEIVYSNRFEQDNFNLNENEFTDFKEILVDQTNEFFIVGAKNYLIKLSFKNDKLNIIDLKNDIVEWKPSEDIINECKRIAKEKYCHNYIKVLAFDGSNDQKSQSNDRLFVCGTNAYKPLCTWRSKLKISEIIDILDGVGKTPKTPDLSSSYLSLPNGDFYFATSIDYSELGMKPDYLIDRAIGRSKQLRTDQYNSNWLNEPVFVASLTIGEYVYFFIRETAIEYMNCGETIYSRVVRICKHDQGADNYEVWKTFEKARINCSIPAGGYRSEFSSDFNTYSNHNSEQEYPFYFDEIQDVYYDNRKNLIYAIFSTPLNGMKGSAICVYDVNSLENAFKGPFKHQKTQDSIWEPYDKEMETPKCEPSNKSTPKTKNLKYADSHKFQLKHLTVQPLNEKPILVLPNKRLLKVVIDNVLTKQQNDIDILFAATESNTILKYSILNTEKSKVPKICLLEEIELFDKNKRDVLNSINNLVLLEKFKPEMNSERLSRHLLISTKFNVIKMQVSNCESQTNYFGCLSTMDPYCIWDSKAQKCLFIFNTNETFNSNKEGSIYQSIRQNNHLHQHSINTCPSTKIPVDGGFSEWSSWSSCSTKSGEKCKCRMRLCNNPEPRNGGKNCDENLSIEILNCEVNGGWTIWSSWSACKLSSPANCEPNSQSNTPLAVRTRTRTCTNPEPKFNGRLCVGLDQEEETCTPEMINPCYTSNTNQWSSWGAWEECSKTCGEGFQMRRRICNGKNCVGCNQEWKTCNSNPCPERKETIITDWDTIESNKESRQKLEKRIKFTCKFDSEIEVNNLDGMNINSTTEFRICEDERFCRSLNNLKELGQWTEWSDWSVCKECGDEQYRSRKCSIINTCFGHDREMRECPCDSKIEELGWSCWSDFSPCSSNCGKGLKKRTRICLNNYNCDGMSEETATCINTNCTNGNSLNEKIINQISSNQNGSFNLSHLIVSCVITFLLGSLLVLVIIYVNIKSKDKFGKNRLLCCCCKSKPSKKKSNMSDKKLSSSLDHNSLGTDTGATTESSDNPKYCSTGSDSSSNSASSNHSKEYFTIGNRFDPTGISSLLNDVIPDDDDDDMLNIAINTGTLNRNKNTNKLGQKNTTTLGLPNKSFNTYVNHKDLNKNSNTSSGLISANVNITNLSNNNNNNISTNTGTMRFSNYSNLHANGSIRSNKNQRTSFAFPMMRTNLDQEL